MNNIFINNSILIIPNEYKRDVLISLNKMDEKYNIKIMSLNEFVSLFTFSFDEKSICYIVENYDVNYKVAKDYLKYIRFLDDKKYKSEKLNFLLKIKKELDENDLLIYDDNFTNFINNKQIVVYGYDYIDKFSLNILNKYNPIIINKEYKTYEHEIYEFNSLESEVTFVAEKICELIKSNKSINNIKIAGINDKYYFTLKRIFSLYNLNININNLPSIYSSNIVKDFLDNLDDIDITLNYISGKYNMDNPDNLYVYNSIIKILNKYYFINDFCEIKEILEEEFKSIKFKEKKYKNKIDIIDINKSIINDDDYVFLLGFNQGLIPKIYKDEEYLSDKEKEELNIETSKENNIKEKEITLNNIKNIKNLIITYKNKSSFDEYYPSSLIYDLNMPVIVNKELNYSYSNLNNKLLLSKKLDNLMKYGSKDDKLEVLYTSYKDIPYKTYCNKYNKVNKDKLKEFLKEKLTLSYSSMDNYYKCPFKYYLNNILRIDNYEETFDMFIGNLFHYILSICFNENFDFETEYTNYIKEKDFSFKEKFYINKLKEDLKFIISTIKKQYTHMSFDKALYEDEVIVNYDKSIKVTFKGFIDKILYTNKNDNIYAIIVDYKTGTPELDLKNAYYGINMQLPIYIYLAKNNNKIKDVKVLGFYLQKILDNPTRKEKDKTMKMSKEERLKLQGYSVNNEELLSIIDDSYENSEVIKSLKMTKNGFSSYSKIISEDIIEKISSFTEEKINNAVDNIIDANFDISPIILDGKNVSCEYCKFKDICNMTYNDVKVLDKKENLDFLGGEEDARVD